MNEHISEVLIKLADILHFLGRYGVANRLIKLSVWLRDQDVPEDI